MSIGNGDLSGMSDSTASYPNTVNGSPTVNGDQSYASSMASMSARSSRANSLIQPPNGYHGIGISPLATSAAGPDGHPVTPGGYGSAMQPYHMRPHSASNPVHPSSFGFGVPPTSAPHGVSNYTASPAPVQGDRAPEAGMNWMFSGQGQDGFMQQGQQNPQQQAPRTEQTSDGHAPPYNGNDAYHEQFLNGMHPHQNQDFGHEEGGA